VFTSRGQIDPVTYTILGQFDEVDSTIPFDYVIMGTSYILGGETVRRITRRNGN